MENLLFKLKESLNKYFGRKNWWKGEITKYRVDHGKLYFNFLFLSDIFEILNFREFDEVKTLWRRKKSRVLTASDQLSSFLFLPSPISKDIHQILWWIVALPISFATRERILWEPLRLQRWLANHPTLQVRIYKFLQKTRKKLYHYNIFIGLLVFLCKVQKREII